MKQRRTTTYDTPTCITTITHYSPIEKNMNVIPSFEYLFNLNSLISSSQEKEQQPLPSPPPLPPPEDNNKFPFPISLCPFVEKFPNENHAIKLINSIHSTNSIPSLNSPHYFPVTNINEYRDLYLDHPPTSYVIIGKPGLTIKINEIADRLSNEFHCVHVNVDALIQREINDETQLGVWLDINRKGCKTIPIEIPLQLILNELRSNKEIHYRGFVLTGLPLIPTHQLNPNVSTQESTTKSTTTTHDHDDDSPFPFTISDVNFLNKYLQEFIYKIALKDDLFTSPSPSSTTSPSTTTTTIDEEHKQQTETTEKPKKEQKQHEKVNENNSQKNSNDKNAKVVVVAVKSELKNIGMVHVEEVQLSDKVFLFSLYLFLQFRLTKKKTFSCFSL